MSASLGALIEIGSVVWKEVARRPTALGQIGRPEFLQTRRGMIREGWSSSEYVQGRGRERLLLEDRSRSASGMWFYGGVCVASLDESG